MINFIDTTTFNTIDSLLVALVAIAIVFIVLIVVILVSEVFQKGMSAVDKRTRILPKKENKILETDEDAVAAMLVASIEFNKETGKEPEIKSITRIEE